MYNISILERAAGDPVDAWICIIITSTVITFYAD